VATLRALGVTPHLAQNTTKRRSAIDARTTRHPGYALSQRARKRVEEIFGWLKTVALLRQTRHRGRARVGWIFLFGLAAYNLIRIRNLTWAPAWDPRPAQRRRGHGRDHGRGATATTVTVSLEKRWRVPFTAVFPWPASRRSRR